MRVEAAARTMTAAQVAQVANAALAEQREEEWIGSVAESAARVRDDPVLWQWTALLHRALDDRISAIAAYERAVALAPRNLRIVHGLARTRWEAGLPSLDHYRRTLALAPFDGDVVLGHAAAQVAAGEGGAALAGLDAVLAQEPRWVEGQRQAAHLRFAAGAGAAFTDGVERALAAHPKDEALWLLKLTLLQQADAHETAASAARRAQAALGDRPFITAATAIAASQMDERDVADAGFTALEPLEDANVAVHHVRHLLRTGRVDRARDTLDPWLGRPEANAFYPYAALVWRLTDKRRYEWLEGSPELVRTFDLTDRLPPLDRLASTLRCLHHASGRPLDQSVRGGTQTDGPLLANIDEDIQMTRRAIGAAVEDYIRALPPPDASHPTLSLRRDGRPRFAGSWSVRLRDSGRHANHVHPAGWISSALYVALPEARPGDAADAGWLTLGALPADLGLKMPPRRAIQPRPGTLVLFPSTMWHGTQPFAAGERLTIAFDIAPPVAR